MWTQSCTEFPSGTNSKEPICQCRRQERQSVGREDPLEEEMTTHSRQVFLPREAHGQRSLVIFSPWGRKEPATTEHSTAHAHGRTPCENQGGRRGRFCRQVWWDCSTRDSLQTAQLAASGKIRGRTPTPEGRRHSSTLLRQIGCPLAHNKLLGIMSGVQGTALPSEGTRESRSITL